MIHTSLISWSSNAWFCLLDTFPSFPYTFLSINNLCYSHIGYFAYTQIQGNFNFIDALDNNSLMYRFIYLLSLFLIISIPEFFSCFVFLTDEFLVQSGWDMHREATRINATPRPEKLLSSRCYGELWSYNRQK